MTLEPGIAWSPDSNQFAIRKGEAVEIWDATRRVRAATLRLPESKSYPWGIAWSPESQRIAVSTEGGQIFVVEAPTGRLLLKLDGHGGPGGQPGVLSGWRATAKRFTRRRHGPHLGRQ